MNIYISIDNSDDKLSQELWSDFQNDLEALIDHAEENERLTIHGKWYSDPHSQWQNMCICVETPDTHAGEDTASALRQSLGFLAEEYKQDSIAWAETDHTQFIQPVT